ncbi:MAG: lipopolysaccharide biosynthesis protein [Chloroflexota bacterium]
MKDRIRSLARPGHLREVASSSLYRNAVYTIGSHGLMAVLGFFFWVIVARFYTEAEVGYSGAIISAMGMVSLVGHLGLETFLIRFLAGARNRTVILNTCLTYSAVVTAAAAVVGVIGLRLFSTEIGFIGHQPVFFVAFVAFAVANTLFSLTGATFVARRQAHLMLVKDFVFSGLKLFLPLAFVTYFHAFGIVASWGLASAAAVAVSLYVLLPRVVAGYVPRPSFRARLLRRAWGYSGMSYLVSLIAVAPKFLMPLLVINVLGPVQNGYFYVAWAIYTVLGTIPGSVAQSMFAEASTNKRSLHRNIARSFLLSTVLLAPAVLFLELFGGQLLRAFGASYSENSVGLLQVLALATIPVTVVRIHFGVLRVTGRMRELLYIRTALTVAILVAAYLTVEDTGINAVGWIYLVGYTIAALGIAVFRSHLWRGPDASPGPQK